MTGDPEDDDPSAVLEKPYNASDPVQVNQARKKAGRKKKASLRVIQALMENEEGRAWIWEELTECFINEEPMVVGDVYQTYRNLGIQSRGKKMLSQAMQFPDLYMLMVSEALKPRRRK